MSNDATLRYQQAAAQGASPLGQIVALYDTVLRDFRRALAALKAGNVEARVLELNHALSVIGYLQGILDYEQGGDAAKQFERLYKLSIRMIVAANAKATPQGLEELLEIYGGLRQAWYEADKTSEMDKVPKAAGPRTPPASRVLSETKRWSDDSAKTMVSTLDWSI